MFGLLLFAAGVGLLGAIIGAIAVSILAAGLPEGGLLGAIVGGSAGILIATKVDARRAENALATSDPEAARRSAALLSRRDRQSRALSSGLSYEHPLKKLDEFASDAEQTRGREAGESQR